MSIPKDYLLKTPVSSDYPGKFHKVFNPLDDSNPDQSEANHLDNNEPNLMNLIIYLYLQIVNLNPIDLALNQSKTSFAEELKGTQCVGDMDTIDYTLLNQSGITSENLDQHICTFASKKQNTMRNEKSPDSITSDQIENLSTIKKAGHLILLHFLNFLGHFPMKSLKTTSLSALINENDDNPYVSSNLADKIEHESLNSPNVLVFTVNETSLMTFLELPFDAFDDSSIWSKISLHRSGNSVLSAQPVRIIIRNVLGKFVWDSIMLTSPLASDKNILKTNSSQLNNLMTHDHLASITVPAMTESSQKETSDSILEKDDLALLIDSIHQLVPECKSEANDLEFVDNLNQFPEAIDTVALMINQHYQECQLNEEINLFNQKNSNFHLSKFTPPKLDGNDSQCSNDIDYSDPIKEFQYCRQIIEQFGFLSWEKRKQINLLSKNQATIRELRHLDNQQCRDKHKIAVIYVGPGQETKESILMNNSGSKDFEEFVSHLGWDVDLVNHSGFMGGLQSNLSTGATAPYFADSFNEVIFHVSTRLEPINENGLPQNIEKQQLMNMKMRHLGNDEIHIVWTENCKEYRRSILATEFGDALIVIYPLPKEIYPNLYRIQLMRKAEVPFFGPLFHGAVVQKEELAGLVRATAINASRGKRLNMENYKPYFEERYDTIQNLIRKHKEPSTFEEFITRIYSPRYEVLPKLNLLETTNPADLYDHGFISLEDFVNNYSSSLSSRSMLYARQRDSSSSITDPHSPSTSSILSTDTISQPQPQSTSQSISSTTLKTSLHEITSNSKHTVQSTGPSASSSSVASLRGLRPNSRGSIK